MDGMEATSKTLNLRPPTILQTETTTPLRKATQIARRFVVAVKPLPCDLARDNVPVAAETEEEKESDLDWVFSGGARIAIAGIPASARRRRKGGRRRCRR
ncbi:hypothetical protein MRB53_028224 [Persea americana]|uniref:Uncharacterized protein n=1 Tax=Persea americana TaxID=3435 RepID=A0ACC2KEX2_PERAE|nr:hypothetical protein MRB53_028224 [Persea americana]